MREVLTSAQMRAVEVDEINRGGVTARELMARAGRAASNGSKAISAWGRAGGACGACSAPHATNKQHAHALRQQIRTHRVGGHSASSAFALFLLKYFLYKKTQLKKVNKTVAEKENGDREVYINKSGDGAKIFSL